MPLGAPKVPYQFPSDDDNGKKINGYVNRNVSGNGKGNGNGNGNNNDDGSWVDLYNGLYQQRVLILGQELNSEVANQLVGLMVYLSIQDQNKDIYLFINSPGGDVISGMAVFDAMHFVDAEIQTICLGVAASMASLVLVGGEPTKRTALPHSKVMIHQPVSSFTDGKLGDDVLDVIEITKMYNNLIDVYAERTGQPASRISKDMARRDLFMTAEEAKAYGIVDTVGDE
uniref:ATP-dependent Clp protease proteolytic subunit 1 n=1 Tax=Astragalus flexus TaxID=2764613 RepID=UPI00279F9A9C|nr:ATP-dependent Clp protease proteolytic subunit 1 [Astragalus flexus]WFG52460.1 ATP-dependent Clp protease proteolytic subunit 1 [Astragalus flexus]WFG52536.1 ATP-dependent Clp protease proteolytic subunit 1 [Astragalus flexus]WFG52612.1 ATP-dependent Clp protease proteolytic subunit 1 [Astragalus flexus]